MPFSKDTAATHGSKGGSIRWKGKIPAIKRDKQCIIKLTQAELDALTEKAKTLKLSRTELIIRAVMAYSVLPLKEADDSK